MARSLLPKKTKAKRRKPFKPEVIKPRKDTALDRAIAAAPLSPPQPWSKISDSLLIRSRLKSEGHLVQPFFIVEPPPRVLPGKLTASRIAMDAGIDSDSAAVWASQAVYNNAFFNGITFLGYPYLSELAQRPEYRRISEVLATDMTRQWIEFKSTSTDADSKVEKIKQLENRLKQLNVRGVFRKMTEIDGLMGRAHLYIDTGATDERDELKTPIGNGRDETTKFKFGGKTGFLKAVKPVEPVWTYPAGYNATDPLKPDWYNPQQWFVQGKQMHVSRLLTFIGREVPDLLKPSYAFGGLSMSQMAKPYIDNWLRTRQSVADLIWTFSTMVLSTDMASLGSEGGDALFRRAALFANLKTNQGLMLINKDSEDFKNVSASLASLDKLQAQAQEQMCSVSGTPVVKLLGVQPAGLNASSEGELTTWYEWVSAYQDKFYREHLEAVVGFCMYDLWGKLDTEIVFEFVPMESLNETELAGVKKTEADTDVAYVGAGILDPTEVREKLAGDKNSPYSGLDVDDVPESVDQEDFTGDVGGMFGIGEEGRADPREERLKKREQEREEDRLQARGDRRAGRDGRGREGDRRTRARPASELVP